MRNTGLTPHKWAAYESVSSQFIVVLCSLLRLHVIMQGMGLLLESLDIGGGFCEHVVDLAIDAAHSAVFSTLAAAERMGLSAAAFVEQDVIDVADTACNAAFMGIQALLEGDRASQDSSSTIDLSAASADDPNGVPNHPI